MKKFLSSRIFRFIWSAGLAALLFYICPPCFSKTAIGTILGILLVLVNAAPWIGQLNWLTQTARILVGGLFIFSGFIKANDPLGFSYKLKEYFEVFQGDTGLSMFEYIGAASLPLAIIICASEIILGIMLLLGYRRDLTLWLLFAQIVFFTFLTFYSACYNKVTHCGCFGDFLNSSHGIVFGKILPCSFSSLFCLQVKKTFVLYLMNLYLELWQFWDSYLHSPSQFMLIVICPRLTSELTHPV